jgi:undecaprenyl-diphosphatase
MRSFIYILGLLPIILYVWISLSYDSSPFLVELDETMSNLLFGNQFITLFHYIGDTLFVVFITTCLLLFLWLRQQNYLAMIFVLLSIAGGTAINQVLKAYYARPRPEIVDQLSSYSFPSGHSMMSVLYLFTLAYIFSELSRSTRLKIIYWIGALVLFILIGLSRVAEGRHFATDVLGGWSLGIVWFTLCVFWYENRKRKLK